MIIPLFTLHNNKCIIYNVNNIVDFRVQIEEMGTNQDEMQVTTSILSFVIRGPKSDVPDENYDNESTLVCRSYNPVIKTSDRHYVETKIALDVQCKLLGIAIVDNEYYIIQHRFKSIICFYYPVILNKTK